MTGLYYKRKFITLCMVLVFFCTFAVDIKAAVDAVAEVKFGGTTVRIVKDGSDNLVFYDTTGSATLSSLISGGGVSSFTGGLAFSVSATTGDITGSIVMADITITSGQVSDFDASVTDLIEGYGYLTAEADTLNTVVGRGAITAVDITVGDLFKIGDGTTGTDKRIYANNGDANLPALQYDEVANAWEFSNNGTTFTAIGSGGGTSDHGGLTGLTDDDHTQYVLADGTRGITGDPTITGMLTVTDSVSVPVMYLSPTATANAVNNSIFIDSADNKLKLKNSGGSVLEIGTTSGSGSVSFTDLTGNPSDRITAGTNISWSTDTLNVDDAFILNTGDVGTGVYDFGGATSLEIPNSNDVSANTTEGMISWDADDDKLYVGNGSGVTEIGAGGGGGATISGKITGLQVSYTASATIRVEAGVYCDNSGTKRTVSAQDIDVSGDLTGTGWGYIYVEYDGGTTIYASTTGVTVNSEGIKVKSDNSNAYLIGNVYTNGGTIRKYYRSGKLVVWDIAKDDTRALDGGTASSFTDVDCSSLIPPTSTRAMFLADLRGNNEKFMLRTNGSAVSEPPLVLWSEPVTSANLYSTFDYVTDSSQIVEYSISAGGTAYLQVIGYYEEIPCGEL